MESNLATAVYMIYTLTAVILLGVFVLLTMRVRHVWGSRKLQQDLKKFQDYFTYMQTYLDEADRLPPPPGRLRKRERNALAHKLFALLERLKGVQCNKLMRLCEDIGLVEQELRRLRSWWKWTRVDAAYRLGMMRAWQAVPVLQRLLNENVDDSTRFVLAQSFARCAHHLDDIRDLVCVLSNSKFSHALIVEILRESQLDYTPVLLECLRDGDPNLQKIALLGLSAHALPDIAPQLHSLTHGEDKEVRIKAVKLLTRDVRNLNETTVRLYLRHPDWEIRAIVARAIGEHGLQGYIPLLKEAVGDPVWWVRSHSARSLAKLGVEGFTALCEIVREETYGDKTEIALQVIQEELEQGTYRQTDLESKLRYNQRLYLYQKICERKHA